MRRWLVGLGAVGAAGLFVFGQAGSAGAATTSPALAARASAAAYVPSKQVLGEGMHGPAVRRLQQRLTQLHYYPGPVDGYFGLDTLEAVWAFKEVQGIDTRTSSADVVGSVMERDLVHPKLPKALVPHGGSMRIEVSLTKQYLVLYKNNKPELISHISPGGGYYFCEPDGGGCGYAITPDGNYRAHAFAPGWVHVPLGEMYNPVFFIGYAYAIHGDIPVPLDAVSHGCVRIPMDIAQFFHKLVHVSASDGTPVYIRGKVPGT
jgi:peptidoglycan hydrolase-like protein with peptidoglycan-binding domain